MVTLHGSQRGARRVAINYISKIKTGGFNMERILERDFLLKTALPALIIVGLAFSMVVIAYGMDGVAKGVHDAFHDFRHTIGMPCH